MRSFAVVVVLVALGGAAFAAEVKDRMEFSNKKGTVYFSHRKHETLADGDCKVCHDDSVVIRDFGKAFAHRVCIGCHEPEPGKVAGPVTCEGCHTGP